LWLWPTLINTGMLRPIAYVISLSLLNIGLIVAAVGGYLTEGNPVSWSAFCQRMRLTRMTGKAWLWALISAFAFGVLALLVNSIAGAVYKSLHFSMPDMSTGAITVSMNILVLFFNIVGEELWWRGYILPRQELAFGRFTWLLHGALWACFHMYKWWAVPFMLVTCQIIPFVAQKTKNTWPGIISHAFVNGVGIILSAL